LADLAMPRQRSLEACSLDRIGGGAAVLVIRIGEVAHSTTQLGLDRGFRLRDLVLHLRGLGSREDRMSERVGAEADTGSSHLPALLPGEHHSLIRLHREARLKLIHGSTPTRGR